MASWKKFWSEFFIGPSLQFPIFDLGLKGLVRSFISQPLALLGAGMPPASKKVLLQASNMDSTLVSDGRH